jgi:hypothetical protein
MKVAGTVCLLVVAFVFLGTVGCGDNARQKKFSDLMYLGLLYHEHQDKYSGRAPSKVEDLEEVAIERQPKGKDALQGLKDGGYVFLWGAKLSDVRKTAAGWSGTVLCYERDVPARGGLVVMVDAAVKTMTADEFKAAPKAEGAEK